MLMASLIAASANPASGEPRGLERVPRHPFSFGLALATAAGARWRHGTGFAHGRLVVAIVAVVVPLWLAVASAFRRHRARSHGPARSPHRRAPPNDP